MCHPREGGDLYALVNNKFIGFPLEFILVCERGRE